MGTREHIQAVMQRSNALIISFLTIFFLCIITISSADHAYAAILSKNDAGFDSQTRIQNYDHLMDALYSNNHIVTNISGKLWVPWYSTSSRCGMNDLQCASSCNAPVIDREHNCMVSDEFSQVGILVSMGDDQQRMDRFYNTLGAIKSTHGTLPSWRIYRNGYSIEQCRTGINGNCDTASDADARVIIALYNAASNARFQDTTQKQKYKILADQMSADFVRYEIVKQCYPSSFGNGEICHWLASGSDAKASGISSSDFAYTAYYPDAIIAMLQACSNTNNQTYCRIASDLTLNYLEASRFDGEHFTVPPGKSFRWKVNTTTSRLTAECTDTCSPAQWDSADAPRAIGICSAIYYSRLVNHTLPSKLSTYCNLWNTKYMTNPSSAPLQYYANGTPSRNYENGYFAQGLQSLMHAGIGNAGLYEETLDSALSHYNSNTQTWDYAEAFGVYGQSFAVRSLGMGIGLDEKAFPRIITQINITGNITSNITNTTNSTTPGPLISRLSTRCIYNNMTCTKTSDDTSGTCRTVRFNTQDGPIKILGCEKDTIYMEVYRQEYPQGKTFTACIAEGCISEIKGFTRVKMRNIYSEKQLAIAD